MCIHTHQPHLHAPTPPTSTNPTYVHAQPHLHAPAPRMCIHTHHPKLPTSFSDITCYIASYNMNTLSFPRSFLPLSTPVPTPTPTSKSTLTVTLNSTARTSTYTQTHGYTFIHTHNQTSTRVARLPPVWPASSSYRSHHLDSSLASAGESSYSSIYKQSFKLGQALPKLVAGHE